MTAPEKKTFYVHLEGRPAPVAIVATHAAAAGDGSLELHTGGLIVAKFPPGLWRAVNDRPLKAAE